MREFAPTGRRKHGHVDRGLNGVDQGRRGDAEDRNFAGPPKHFEVADGTVGAVALKHRLFLIETLDVQAHDIVHAPFLVACRVTFVLSGESVTGQRRRRDHEDDEQKCRSPHGDG